MQEKAIQDQIHKLVVKQELYWAQRAHQKWITFGDKYQIL